MSDSFTMRVRRLYQANRQGLYTYALGLSRDGSTAEDAVQAAIYRLLRRGRLPKDPRPYLYRCVRNVIVDLYRKNGRTLCGIEPERSVAGNGNDPVRSRMIQQSLDRLSPDERETVLLKAVDGLTFREIAVVRRKTVNTVASWYRRGLRKMRASLEG